MKIDRTRIKKSTSEVPAECQALIEKLRACNKEELLNELRSIETWTYGKCELYHWIDILDLCDGILEAAAAKLNPKSCQLNCDKPKGESKELLLWVLHFTTLLIEHSFSRHLYNSMEHLLTLMSSCDLNVLLGVLNLLYMFSKRSNFLTRLSSDVRLNLLTWLTYLAENWGGKEHGFGLADCCRNNPKLVPSSATTLHHEFYTDESRKGSSQASCIHIEHVDKLGKNPSEIMDSLTEAFSVPKEEHIMLFTHVRLAYSFSNYKLRLKCVQARLQALSVLLYSNSFSDCNTLLYSGLLDELVELLELKDPELEEIHSAALRTLTSILHLDRNSHLPKKAGSRLNVIIDVTGAGLYHGFLPQLVRTCINLLTGKNTTYPLPLATALFSFLYHLASYETGGEALVSCGMMECLLRVINWNGTELEHITFVTRAVRVIDLITNIDMQGFQSHNGLTSFINRLEMEIDICRVEQPYVIYVRSADSDMRDVQMDLDSEEMSEREKEAIRMSQLQESQPGSSKDLLADVLLQPVEIPDKNKVLCLPQRAALLKSMLNFLKKALQDPAFSDSIRHVMDGSLPATLKHIVSNPDYYGPSLFLLATDVVAVYVFQEPSLLSSLQDNGLTDVVLHALLVKNVPSTREVLGSLPNVFSALCLNARGLNSFVKFNPFDRLFRVLLSPMYLVAMRRRRSADPIGDTAVNLGNAMDELMRHQPALKAPAIAAIIELLKTLCQLGRDPKFVCWKPQKGSVADSLHNSSLIVSRSNDGGSSDEEDDDEEEASTSSHPQQEETTTVGPTDNSCYEKTPIALIDYIMNVMKFVDAILSNNSTDDHCREFVSQGGLAPLLSVLALPNLPVDYPIVPAAQSVAAVCKSILNLAHEPQVMKEGLNQLHEILETLEPLYKRKKSFSGSVLLEELAQSGTLETTQAFTNPSLTPLLHAMVAAHGYVAMFVYVCRTGQLDIRTISMTHWGSELGLRVLDLMSHLYTALVWESTILLTLCCQDSAFGLKKEEVDRLCPHVKLVNSAAAPKKEEIDRLCPYVKLVDIKASLDPDMFPSTSKSSEKVPTESNSQTHSHQKSGKKVAQQQTIDIKYLKPLLGVSSRLGRALAELFGLLVKLCVGFPVRTRRGNHLTSTPVSPTPSAQAVATSLAKLLARGLNCDELPHSSIAKFKLTFLICSVGFTSPMLFDEKKFPFHLMLQKFVRLNGQTAFFSAFRWALTGGDKFSIKSGLENPKLPETTGEFLDAWLMLLEKMVNPKAVLESTHMLPPKPTPNCKKFDPIKYLQRIHKMAFLHISYLWGKKPLKTYGARMTETMLTIFKHILRGEKILEEEFEEEEEVEALKKEVLDEFTADALSVCLELLEVLPETVYRVAELLNAIMRRNGEKFTYDMLSTLAEGINFKASYLLNIMDSLRPFEEIVSELVTSTFADKAATLIHLYMLLFEEVRIPCANVIHSSGMLPMLNLLVIRGTEIISVGSKSETPKWLAPILLLIDLLEKVSYITHRKADMHNATSCIWRWFDLTTGKWCLYMPNNNKLINESYWRGDKTLRIASGRRRYTIMFQQMVQTNEDTGKQRPIMMTLRNPYHRDDSDTESNQESHSQSSSSAADSGVDNVPTGRFLLNLDHAGTASNSSGTNAATVASNISSNISALTNLDKTHTTAESDDTDTDFFHRRTGMKGISGLKSEDVGDVVRACVTMIKIPVEPDTLHAAMQVCIRYTRSFENARITADLGIVKILLKLTQASAFNGFIGLATILIRHILEEPLVLHNTMEKVLRTKVLPSVPPSYKELHYVLRECGAVACRNPEVFENVVRENLRVDTTVLNKRNEEDDPRLLMKALIFGQSRVKYPDETAHCTINDLMNSLITAEKDDTDSPMNGTNGSTDSTADQSHTVNNSDGEGGSRQSSSTGSRPSTRQQNRLGADILNLFPDDGNSQLCDSDVSETFSPLTLPMYMTATAPIIQPAAQKSNSTENLREKKKPALSKAAILKILGDAVRSYPTIARFVSEHRYFPTQSDTIKEECTAIAYVLDNLMVPRENSLSDLDRPNMARMLIAALASSNHAHESQITLVSEVKAALARTMEWPESAKKHSHIQDLVGIVTIMIEHCPPVPITSATLTPSLRLNQFSVNNMVRYMIRKGIIADLAHIPHQLDLSSPKMPLTMNAVLKPLETLARLTSQPTGPSHRTKQKQQTNTAPSNDDLPVLQRDNNSSGIIHIEGEENNEEAGRAQNDVAGAGNSSNQDVDVALAAVRLINSRGEMMTLSPDSARRSRMDFSSLRFQQQIDGVQLSSPPSSSEDSDSNSSNDGGNNMDDTGTDLDLQEDDDDEDDENNQGDENGEENGGSFDEEGLELFASDAGLFRIPLLDHDSEDLLMIEYSEPDTGSGLGPWPSNSPFPLPFSLFEDPTNLNIDSSALSRIPTHHPLLMTRQNVEASNSGGARPQRLNRPRRYQYLHMNRSSGAPVFLQRIMSEQTFMQPNNSGNSDVLNSPFGGNTRVIVLDNGLGILTNAEEEQINFVDQSGYLMGPSLAATLSNVPTALHWWAEESKLVDGESQPDQSLIIAFKLAYFFERLKIDEICSHKEKKKKQDDEYLKKNGSNNGKDSDKKFFRDGFISVLDPPQSRPPTNRRIAMLAAAQEVAQATGELAGSIVESVLHPRTTSFPRTGGPTFVFTSSPLSPQSDPPENGLPSGENGSNDILMDISDQIEAHNIPAALELIPVTSSNNTTTGDLTDPLGLIPGSVPFPPPSDPDDGFFRVNPPPLVSFCDESSSAAASPPHDNIFSPEPQVPNIYGPLELDSWSQVPSQEMTDNNCPALIEVSQSSPEESALITIHSGDEELFADEDEPQDQDDLFEPEPVSESQTSEGRSENPSQPYTQSQETTSTRETATQDAISISSVASQETIIVSSEEEVTMSQPNMSPPTFAGYGEVRHTDTIRSLGFPEDRRRRRIRVISSRSRSSQDPSVSEENIEGSIVISSAGASSSSSSLDEVPEGVDPSFLAALPEEMRAEVLSEHIRLQRLRQQVESNMSSDRNSQDNEGIPPEVNPDFLAALPLNIQEEVLAQQRLEQQRQAAASSNPNDPVDPVAFFQELPPSLRQSILADMEDSQISVLPPELAAEAQNLRREWEVRNRQMMQDRFINHVANSTGALSSILRTTGGRGIRRTGGRLSIQNITSSNRPHWMSNWSTRFPMMPHLTNAAASGNENSRNPPFVNTNVVRSRGKQVLDYESICCLLVLLFVDDARLNTVRLHRVFRHICCHAPTRDWVIHALLSIMERSNDCSPITSDLSPSPSKRMTTRSQSHNAELAAMNSNRTPPRPLTSWLNISMDAALGCRATVFQVHKPPGRRSERTISINPQAAPFVYRHALDILISLAKNFPMFFIPSNLVNLHGTVYSNQPPNTASTSRTAARMNRLENFWDLLIRLDSISSSKKGKTTSRVSSSQPNINRNMDAFEISPFGQLLGMLGTPVVQRSQVLTDKLLKLLGIITVSFFCSKYHLDMLNVSAGTLRHLGVAVDLLTSNTCSEEGLEDATGLLLNVTVNIPSTRPMVLAMLLQSARNMATLVRQHIEDLRKELKALNCAQSEDEDQQSESRGFNMKGVLRNRFTKDSVVVTVPKKIKAGMDLQLSSMTPLISKSSSQAFLLRILKVIVQLKCAFHKVTPKRRPELDNEVTASNNRPSVSNNRPSASNTPSASTSPSASTRPSAGLPSASTRPSAGLPSASVNNVTPEPEWNSTEPERVRDEDGNVILAPDSDDEDMVPETPPRPIRFSARQPIVIPESPEKSPEESRIELVDDASEEPPLCESLDLDDLWNTLSACLTELAHTQDSHAVLVLQPAVEAFFLVHSSNIERLDLNDGGNARIFPGASRQVPEEMAAPAPPPVSPLPNDPTAEHPSSSGTFPSWQAGDSLTQPNVPAHQQKFLKFAETHRMVLNQILRQCTTPLLEGPFAVLVNHTRVLDFDVKRRYFRGELERADEGHRREELAVHIRRGQVFEDSFRELHRRSPDDWKNRFYIVFEGEEGQDAGGLLREWYMIISREIFNPMYALFTTSPGDRVTYMINQCSHCNPNHLCYFKFVGRVIAKAIYDNKLLECYFTRSFYKHILGIQVKYTDMESEDYSFYQGLVYLMENRLESLGYEVTFSTEVQEFGVTEIRDLIPNGRNLLVTEDNKMEYIRLVCQMKMTGAIRKQLNAFLEGFYDIIPMRLISIFNEQELELLISGLPNVDIDDLKANTEYYKYQQNSLQIQWFWRALREFDQAERAKFLQFVTGTSKVPLQGFTALEGMNGIQKFQIHRDERSTDRLPSAHTCFNQLDLPVYETYTKLRSYLLKAIHECSEGFGFA